MWMMGYNEPVEDHMNMLEPYNNATRKLRPLVPRPPPSSSSYNRFHHHPLNHHHVAGEDNSKREFNAQQMVVVSSRWNPTPEQLQTLEELYRRGTRTPSAEEIQQITAQLRRFGKIEGKNVFYWFQNHKARERQKRRRQLDKDLHINVDHSIHRKDSSELLVEETRNWAIPTFSDQKNMVREKSRKGTGDEGWMIHANEEQEEEELGNDQLLHRRRKSLPSTWNHMMQCLAASSSSGKPINQNDTVISSTSYNRPTPTTTAFATSKTPSPSSSVVVSSSYETLELFPVNNSTPNGSDHIQQAEKCLIDEMSSSSSDVNFSPHFFEFLPLKN